MDPMKCGGETALTCDEIWPALEDLRRQSSGHRSWLIRKGPSHIKLSGGIMAGDNFDRADRLRPHLLRGVKSILRTGGTRFDLRYVENPGDTVVFLDVCELRILTVNIQRRLRVGFLLRRFNDGEVGARDRSGERLPCKFVISFQRLAFSFCRSFFRANTPPHVGLPRRAAADAIYPTL